MLRLNIVPIELEGTTSIGAVRRLGRDQQSETQLRAIRGNRRRFLTHSWQDGFYIWPLPGGTLPSTELLRSAEAIAFDRVPPETVAFACREAAARRLEDEEFGFSRTPFRVAAPARLYRKKRNLASQLLSDGQAAQSGIYPLISIQGITLQDQQRVPRAALVLDLGLLNVLDVPLALLADSGLELERTHAIWRHGEDCRCAEPRLRGPAGRISGGDPRGLMKLRDRSGSHQAPAQCLQLTPQRRQLEQYFTRLTALDTSAVHARLDREISQFEDPGEQWKALQALHRMIDGTPVTEGVVMKLLEPVHAPVVPEEDATFAIRQLAPLNDPPLNFRYGAPVTATAAAVGLREHGPYDEAADRVASINALVIAPRVHRVAAERLTTSLSAAVGRFPGMERRYHLASFGAILRVFDGADAAAYRNAAVLAARDRPDIVFLVTRKADRLAAQGQNPYLAAKAVLAGANIASQAITVEVINQPESSLQWSLDSVALQSYAKVGNVPFVLHDPGGSNEIVLGVGRADVYDPADGGRLRRFGVAAVFRQDGDFLYAGSTVPVIDEGTYEASLSRLLGEFIERYEREQAVPLDRLTIHLFKRTGHREQHAVAAALGERSIEFALVHVNRDSPLWVVEVSGSAAQPAPPGTVVEISPLDRLLVTGSAGSAKKRSLHPIRITLDPSSTFRDMDRIVWQLYGLTATSWRGFHRTTEPNTILYSRLLAHKVQDLEPYGLTAQQAAGVLADRPWFL